MDFWRWILDINGLRSEWEERNWIHYKYTIPFRKNSGKIEKDISFFKKKKITTKENSEIELRTEIEFRAECKYQEDFIVALG